MKGKASGVLAVLCQGLAILGTVGTGVMWIVNIVILVNHGLGGWAFLTLFVPPAEAVSVWLVTPVVGIVTYSLFAGAFLGMLGSAVADEHGDY